MFTPSKREQCRRYLDELLELRSRVPFFVQVKARLGDR
jgi:hypothetical protein